MKKDSAIILGCSGLILGASYIFLSSSKSIERKSDQLKYQMNRVEDSLIFTNQKIDNLIKLTTIGNQLLDRLLTDEVDRIVKPN